MKFENLCSEVLQPAKPRVELWTASECYNSVGLFSQQLECRPISFRLQSSSSFRMRNIKHNWSATKQRSVPVPCENGSVETTVAEVGQNPVAGLWGRILGQSWPPEPTSSYSSIDFRCQLVASPATTSQVVIGQNRKVYIWRKLQDVWRLECLGGGKCHKIFVMFWSCINHQGILGTLVPIDRNIDSRKCVKVLDENLWLVVCKTFAGRHFIFQDENDLCIAHLWKDEHHISSFLRPALLPDINIIENVWKVMKAHAQKDLSCIKPRQDLIEFVLNACWMNRSWNGFVELMNIRSMKFASRFQNRYWLLNQNELQLEWSSLLWR